MRLVLQPLVQLVPGAAIKMHTCDDDGFTDFREVVLGELEGDREAAGETFADALVVGAAPA